MARPIDRTVREMDVERDLLEALQPFRGFVLAAQIQNFLASGLYDELEAAGEPGAGVEQLCERGDRDAERLTALLWYLVNEDYLTERDGCFRLTPRAHRVATFRAYYEMMIGGYGGTFLQMGAKLERGAGPAARDGARVGSGSCGISMFDSIPIVRRLLEGVRCDRVLDLGCGSAVYLTEICRWRPACTALGVEPDPGAYREALAEVERAGLSDRIQVVNADALRFLETMTDRPDVVILAFVAHEVLGQEGEQGVRRLLGTLFERAPDTALVVIEVDHRVGEANTMRHALATTYYNAYYLLHPFTRQRLMPAAYWDELFESCGLRIAGKETTDVGMDSTGLELGYLLRRT